MLALPTLPSELVGVTGCRLQHALFDEQVGPEVYLAILEAGTGAMEVAATKPFQLFCKTGVGSTPHGLVAFCLWTTVKGSLDGPYWEQFLNPHHPGTIELLQQVGAQTHLKVLIIDSLTSEVVNWFEFENVYGFDRMANGLRLIATRSPPGDFERAQQAFMDENSVEDLLAM
jgi:hypothetical protein